MFESENYRSKITGGGGTGIGNALVCAFAQEGTYVAYCDITNLEKTAQDIAAYKVQSYSEIVDIGNKAAIQRFGRNVINEFGHIDILINNAGIALEDIDFEETTAKDFEKITNINYWGVIRTSMFFYPYLLKRPEAAIVNISSSQGILAAPYLVSYCTTKFAVRGFTDSLRAEHKIKNINELTVHTVHPGAVATNITLHATYHGTRSEKFHELLQKQGISPQAAAQKILKGIRKNTARIFISDGRIQDIVARLFPSYSHLFVKLHMKWNDVK